MKKMLLASAFALFGTFAMANEKSESQFELKTKNTIEFIDCVISTKVNYYDSCGNFLFSEVKKRESTNCKGAVITGAVETTLPGPCKAPSLEEKIDRII